MRAEGELARFGFVVLVAVALAACGVREDATLAAAARVTQAFPPAEPVRGAHQRLRDAYTGEADALAAIEDDYSRRMTARALDCSKEHAIARLDTVESITGLRLPRDCFARHDAELLAHLTWRLLSALLAQPPLRPMPTLGAPMRVRSEATTDLSDIDLASEAGVALLRDTRSALASVEIPAGTRIATLDGITDAHGAVVRVAPNGRIAAVSTNHYRGLAIASLESGETLWESGEYSQLLAWLPEQSAALLDPVGSGGPALLDFERGRVEPFPAGQGTIDWAVALPGMPARLLAGSARDFATYRIGRLEGALSVERIASHRIRTGGGGVTSSWPTSMRNGHAIVFVSGRNLMMVDLENGTETLWEFDRRILNRYAKLGETTLLVDSWGAGPAGVGMSPWVLDIEAGSLAPGQGAGQKGLLFELKGRTGYARRGTHGFWIGAQVETGPARPAQDVFEEIDRIRRLPEQEASRATGAGRAPQHDPGRRYCCEASGCGELEREVRRLAGRVIDRFQGRYAAAESTVNIE